MISDSESYSDSESNDDLSFDDELCDMSDYLKKEACQWANNHFEKFIKTLSTVQLQKGMTMAQIRRRMENFVHLKISNNSIGKLKKFPSLYL